MTKYCNVCLRYRNIIETFIFHLSLLEIYRYSKFIVDLSLIRIYLCVYNTLMRFLYFRISTKSKHNQSINQSINQSLIIKRTSTRTWRFRVNFDRIARIRSQKYHNVENRNIAKISLTKLDKTWQFLYDKSEMFW